jgi:hypothetical protein
MRPRRSDSDMCVLRYLAEYQDERDLWKLSVFGVFNAIVSAPLAGGACSAMGQEFMPWWLACQTAVAYVFVCVVGRGVRTIWAALALVFPFCFVLPAAASSWWLARFVYREVFGGDGGDTEGAE